MAISGMHIGMLAALAAWLAAATRRHRLRRGGLGTVRDAAVVAGTGTAVAYSALAGWSVPTERTVVMIAIVAAALRLRRRVAAGDVLALGALSVLVVDPLAPLAPGFWLSFVAVAAILFIASGHLAPPGALRGFAAAQLAVTVGLVPVLVGSFALVSLVSAPVNALAIPLYTLLIVPGVLLAAACATIAPVIGTPALEIVAWFIEVTWPLIDVPASWRLAAWGIAGLPWAGSLALAGGAAAALAPLPPPARLAGFVIVAVLCAWRAEPPPHGALHFAILDVGQGLAAVVETRRHVLVYDTGPSYRSGADAGALAVEPYLRHRGVRRIDVLVASHDDNDHAGGAAALARTFPVGRLVASGHALRPLGAVEPCSRGQRWDWDGVTFEWLQPGPDLLPKDNDRSCVLQIRSGSHVLLLPGDVERAAEEELLRVGHPDAADVLLVPHHGSRTSSTPSLVAATRPRYAVVSAGYRNRWGFPADEVVERWRKAGAVVIETSTSGAIEFRVDPSQPLQAPREWRRLHRRLWQDP
jgi:competence protein ComEC